MQELKTPTGRFYLTVETDRQNQLMVVNCKGYLTADSIQTGAAAYTAALARAGYSRVLNDTREGRGPWDHSMEWIIQEWAPNAAGAGLRYFAMVTSPETFDEESASTFYQQLTAF
ncbi:STAS/SEC14 domain-containing protein [Hymenobacter sp. BT730]|uniref:STAS/SEC14 domain-containing protein n=1 Tax=Hymenobacter sp. BT730 TaxID=3063332 RepID=UPI0026E0286F|nr:STAS/SEC14 domain-containing protein [Hymenobacter sp. BT730]